MRTRFRLPLVVPLAFLGVAAAVAPAAAQSIGSAIVRSLVVTQPVVVATPRRATATIHHGAAGPAPRVSRTAADLRFVAGLDSAFQLLALKHRQLALDAGLPFEFVSGRRSRSRQAALAADRTRTRPVAPPGRSRHERGLAYDIRASGLTAAQLRKIGELGESIGVRWGGRFTPRPDPNHFEVQRASRCRAAARRTTAC